MTGTTFTGLMQDIAINLLVSLLVFAGGYLFGRWRVRRQLRGRNLEQYDFYPFTADKDGFPQFSLDLFQRGVKYLLAHDDSNAAGQMIVIGEQKITAKRARAVQAGPTSSRRQWRRRASQSRARPATGQK